MPIDPQLGEHVIWDDEHDEMPIVYADEHIALPLPPAVHIVPAPHAVAQKPFPSASPT